MDGRVWANGRRDSGRADHVCLVYTDPAELQAEAVAFLRRGIAAGHRLEYVATRAADAVRATLATAGLADCLDRGDLTVRSLEDLYGADEVVEPHEPVAAYAAATREALALGYTGLRVVAEATALVRTPAQREAFARYEHLIDRYMLDHPFFALCAYDARELGGDVTDIACLHPTANPGATAFRWHPAPGADVTLAGEVDLVNRGTFEVALARTLPLLAQPRMVVDARRLDFIDHQGLLILERQAAALDTEVAVLTRSPLVQRLADLLELQAVQPVSAR
jgi:anti-anti-sigma regulatory factor